MQEWKEGVLEIVQSKAMNEWNGPRFKVWNEKSVIDGRKQFVEDALKV